MANSLILTHDAFQELVNELEREFETVHAHIGGGVDRDGQQRPTFTRGQGVHLDYHIGAILRLACCFA